MSLFSILRHGQQPEGGLLGYVTRHVLGGNPVGQAHDQIDAGIAKGRDQIIAGLNAVIGDHEGQLDDIVKALADSAVVAAAAAATALVDKTLPGGGSTT